MDESDKSPLELLAKLAQQLASLQRECSELRRELDDAAKVQQEQLEQLAALKAKYDQLCRERDAFPQGTGRTTDAQSGVLRYARSQHRTLVE